LRIEPELQSLPFAVRKLGDGVLNFNQRAHGKGKLPRHSHFGKRQFPSNPLFRFRDCRTTTIKVSGAESNKPRLVVQRNLTIFPVLTNCELQAGHVLARGPTGTQVRQHAEKRPPASNCYKVQTHNGGQLLLPCV
jgi:hypothetical protein